MKRPGWKHKGQYWTTGAGHKRHWVERNLSYWAILIRQVLGQAWSSHYLTEYPVEIGGVITTLQMETSTINGEFCKNDLWTSTGPQDLNWGGWGIELEFPIISGTKQAGMTPKHVPIWEWETESKVEKKRCPQINEVSRQDNVRDLSFLKPSKAKEVPCPD